MTIADFLFQAGFWQWVGTLMLVGVVSKGIGRFRLWGNVTKTVNKTETNK